MPQPGTSSSERPGAQPQKPHHSPSLFSARMYRPKACTAATNGYWPRIAVPFGFLNGSSTPDRVRATHFPSQITPFWVFLRAGNKLQIFRSNFFLANLRSTRPLGEKSFLKNVSPVKKIFGNRTPKITSNLREKFVDFRRPDSLDCEFDPSDHNKVLELLS